MNALVETLVATLAAGLVAATSGTLPREAAPTQQPPSMVVQPVQGQRFWVKDKTYYGSAWYAGKHRKMIGFGCTPAPYYDPSPRCRHRMGFHHGIDIAMPCGTKLYAGFQGWVVRPNAPGRLGTAYGRRAFRLRSHVKDVDVVIGHSRKVYVAPGDRIRRGQLIARANDAGAPDGCHLHFEVRPIGGGYKSAIRPGPYIQLRR